MRYRVSPFLAVNNLQVKNFPAFGRILDIKITRRKFVITEENVEDMLDWKHLQDNHWFDVHTKQSVCGIVAFPSI